jgi:hypothetical protein
MPDSCHPPAGNDHFAEVNKMVPTNAELAAAFRRVGIAARRAAKAIEPLARLIIEAERGPSIGRKRRKRRARGRRRNA